MNGSTPGKEELELIERLDKAASEKTAALRGLGGWLILFQLRIYLGILLSIYILIAYRHDILFLFAFVITLAPITVCMVLFYRKKLLFRTVYTVRAAALCLARAFMISIPDFLGTVISEGIIVYALFSSNRIRNTFS